MRLPKHFCRDPSIDEMSLKEKSEIAERALAKDLGLKKTPGSGNKSKFPADVFGKRILVEHKFTDKKSIALKLDWLEKIVKEASRERKSPVLVLEIQGKRWFLVQEPQFKIILEVLEK